MLPAECSRRQTTGDGRTFSRRYGATRRESCLRSCRETRKSPSSCAVTRSWIGEARACTNGPSGERVPYGFARPGISEDFINIENAMQECLHVFLPGKPFDETMLKDLDIDPSGISIRYEAIDRDPFIEYVADQILKEMEVEILHRPAFDRKPRKRPVGPSGARLCGDVHSPETIHRRAQAARSETAVARDGFHQRLRRARFHRQ